jgi:hypothetical protein
MRINEYETRQYIEILKSDDEEIPSIAFYDTKEEWEDLHTEEEGYKILYHGYVILQDVEIADNEDFADLEINKES